MSPLTSKERITRIFKRQPVDHVGLSEGFWGETNDNWIRQGHVKQGEDLYDHFGIDFRFAGWVNSVADLDFKEVILEETEEWKLSRNGNGAALKWWKGKAGTPEHVDFLVKDRAGWEEHIRPHLLDDSRLKDRVDVEGFRKCRQMCNEKNLYFAWMGLGVFEQMHPMCGHEYMLMGMALDPDWVKDMCEVYADMTIKAQQYLIEKAGGPPDGFYYLEDLGFKLRPFMSPAMYKDIIWPSHKKQFDFAHSLGCPVMVHSCGFVESLVPDLIEAGMDCLDAMEVKAGMDLVRLKKTYGDRLSFSGGLDARVLETNDLQKVEALLLEKLPIAMEGSGYILHTDHSISQRVNYETYAYFVKRGLEIGTY